MPDLTLGEWLPDQPRVASPGLRRCENVIPTSRGYRPFPSRALVVGKDPLAGPCIGAWAGESQSGEKFILAGTETGGDSNGPALYLSWSEGGAFWDVSPGSAITGLLPSATWDFARAGTIGAVNEVLVATAKGVSTGPLQLPISSAPSASSEFVPLSANASRAAVCVEWKQFLILGDIEGQGANAGAIGVAENGIHWSALNDPTSWPQVGTAAAVTALSDFQIFGGDGGAVTNLVPAGEYLLVFQETQIWRMDFVGGNAIFSFRLIAPETGCIMRNGAIAANGLVYFISEHGFAVCDGARVQDIGSERVDDTFLGRFSGLNSRLTSSAYVPKWHSVLWTVTEGANLPVRLYGYEFLENRWFEVVGQDQYQWVFTSHTLALGGSLDLPPLATQNMDVGDPLATTNLDLLGVTDGANALTFFDQNNEIAFYSDGSPSAVGKIETGDFEFPDRERRVLRCVRPIWEDKDGTIALEAAGRNYMTEDAPFKSLNYDTTTGLSRVRMDQRVGGRYLRTLITLSGEYDEMSGLDVILADGRGKR